MSASYRDHFAKLREQAKMLEMAKKPLDPVRREQELLGDVELVVDSNDLPPEVEKNLESTLSPIDTELEVKLKGFKLESKKPEPEDSLEPESPSLSSSR